MWKGLIAPEIAVKYWKLEQGSTMKDVILGKQVLKIKKLLCESVIELEPT